MKNLFESYDHAINYRKKLIRKYRHTIVYLTGRQAQLEAEIHALETAKLSVYGAEPSIQEVLKDVK